MEPMINIALRAARRAGEHIVRASDDLDRLQVRIKDANDFVSEVDERAEEIIVEQLKRAYPGHAFLGEESGLVGDPDAEYQWVIDPLDGTTNFLHGMPHWAISVALEYKGEIVAGVVLDPVKDEMFVAEKGAGAWLNDRRLRVSARRDMTEMVFATGIPFAGTSGLPEMLTDLSRVMPRCAGVRRFGSAALDLAWVAAGRYDGYWERGLKPWDMAAGLLMVREAGGFVDSLSIPDARPIDTGDVIATNSEVFEKFCGLIRG